ncbi:MAG: DNA primase [Cycloclasticus sp.]
MAGRIPQQFIDDLLARTDVVDVIDSLLPLKKKGANYSACCPFHNEKTPSFTVSQDKQFFHCFGCGVSGSAIGFLMDYSHLSFVEAVEELASRAGVEVQREQGFEDRKPVRDLAPLRQMNEQTSEFYQQQLRQHADSNVAATYLKNRGLTGEIAKTFQLGFAPPGWSNLLSSLGQGEASLAILRELGLIVSNDNNKTYDRFRERIIFPIRNKRGQTIGFGGRVLDSGEPKYLNSPETPLYHKGREVYGLYEALQSSTKIQRLVLVEGYLDVISLAQHGLTNVVAALGTAITREQIDLMFRSVSELVICMDGDSAGQKAAWRAVVNALPTLRSGRQIKVLLLVKGQDPDSLIRQQGVDYLSQLIDEAAPLSNYFFDYLAEQYPLEGIEGRAAFVEQARPLLSTLPEGTFADMMKKQLALLTQTDAPSAARFEEARSPARASSRAQGKKRPSLIRRLICTVLHEPQLAATIAVDEPWLNMDMPGMPVLKQVLQALNNEAELSPAMLLERLRGGENGRIINSLFAEEKLIGGEALGQEMLGAIARLKEQAKQARLEELLARSSELTDSERLEFRELIK